LIKVLLIGLGFMLIFEGLMPLISPTQWREFFAQVAKLRDGQIRFMGLGAVALGALFLLFAL
jgi:uncharacterized protein